MKIGFNPSEAKAAEQRLRKKYEADKKILEAQQPKKTVGGLGFRLGAQRREEGRTLKTVASARRKETEAQRRTQQAQQKTAAEKRLQTQQQQEVAALRESREARKARLLTEQELRRARTEPYTRTIKEIGKGAVAAGGGVMAALRKLDEKNREYARTHQNIDPIWGGPKRQITYTEAPLTFSETPRRTVTRTHRPSVPRRPNRLLDFDPVGVDLDPNELMR